MFVHFRNRFQMAHESIELNEVGELFRLTEKRGLDFFVSDTAVLPSAPPMKLCSFSESLKNGGSVV